MLTLTFTRATMDRLPHTTDRSEIYWRADARRIFALRPDVNHIEVVRDGCKTTSRLLDRGEYHPWPGNWVVIASTGGRWGRSRRDYSPRQAVAV